MVYNKTGNNMKRILQEFLMGIVNQSEGRDYSKTKKSCSS